MTSSSGTGLVRTGSAPACSRLRSSVSHLNLVYGWRGADLVGCLGPGEWVASVVTAVDEGADGGDEVFDAVEGSAADGLAGDDPEEDLDQVQPGATGGCSPVPVPNEILGRPTENLLLGFDLRHVRFQPSVLGLPGGPASPRPSPAFLARFSGR